MSKCVIRGASLRARAPHSCLRHTLGHKRTSKLLHVGSSKVTERLQYRHATQFQRPMYTRRRLRSRSEPVLPESNISSATATSAQAPVSMRPRRSIASYAAVAQAQPPASTLASAPPIATQTVDITKRTQSDCSQPLAETTTSCSIAPVVPQERRRPREVASQVAAAAGPLQTIVVGPTRGQDVDEVAEAPQQQPPPPPPPEPAPAEMAVTVAPVAPVMVAAMPAPASVSSSGTEAIPTPAPLPVRGFGHFSDPVMRTYVRDMYAHYRLRETKHPDAGFMRMQTHINERMRAILMDWLVDVHLKYRQSTETLHLTASLVDRYLSRVPVPRAKLQLIGVAAMLISSKYEQCFRYEVRVEDMVYICDKTYSIDEVRMAEKEILRALDYTIGLPTAHTFALRYLAAAGVKPTGSLPALTTAYLLESAMIEVRFAEFAPSLLAAAAVDVALRAVEGAARGWCAALVAASGYTAPALRPAVIALEAAVLHGNVLQPSLSAVRRKYSSQRFGAVASLAVPATTPPPLPLPKTPPVAPSAATATAPSTAPGSAPAVGAAPGALHSNAAAANAALASALALAVTPSEPAPAAVVAGGSVTGAGGEQAFCVAAASCEEPPAQRRRLLSGASILTASAAITAPAQRA